MKRWSSPFFTQHPARAILESLMIGIVFESALLLLQPLLVSFTLRLGICLAIGLICVIFSAFRLQLPGGSRRRQMLFEASVGSVVSLLLGSAELVTLLVLLRGASLNPLWRGSSRPLLTALIALLLNVVVFLTFRMGIRLWLFWNRLRHRQLLWALTYAHVMILLPFSYSKVSEPTLKRSVLPASSSIAMAREPLDRPSRFGLTSTPQAFYVRR